MKVEYIHETDGTIEAKFRSREYSPTIEFVYTFPNLSEIEHNILEFFDGLKCTRGPIEVTIRVEAYDGDHTVTFEYVYTFSGRLEGKIQDFFHELAECTTLEAELDKYK